MEGGGQGLEDGLPTLMRSVSDVMDDVKYGMTFAPTKFNLAAVGMHERGAGFNYGGDKFTFNIYSPKALDSVTAAREAKKAAQKITMGFI